MKKFFVLLFLALCLIANVPKTKLASAKYTTYIYARVENSGVYLYKNTTPTPTNALFEIPQTYFVLILSNFDANFYKAQYRDVVGYVLKKEVVPVSETPKNPFLETVTFRVYSSDGTGIMSTPFDNKIEIGKVKELEDIDYYGTIIGTEEIEDRGFTWIYGKTNSGVMGYFYAGLCDKIEGYVENNETTTILKDAFKTENKDYLYNLVDISTGLKILLISLITIPAIALLVLLFVPFPKKQVEIIKKKNTIKKPKTFKQIQDYNDDLL